MRGYKYPNNVLLYQESRIKVVILILTSQPSYILIIFRKCFASSGHVDVVGGMRDVPPRGVESIGVIVMRKTTLAMLSYGRELKKNSALVYETSSKKQQKMIFLFGQNNGVGRYTFRV